jgi:hypothetical protein
MTGKYEQAGYRVMSHTPPHNVIPLQPLPTRPFAQAREFLHATH